MPRRKPTADEGGRRAQFSGLEHNETMVISDSDHEEEKDSPIKRSSRAARWRRRENESHLRDLTEEEMLEMAMKLSAQEANSAAQRQQLEDNDVQKAIVESLNDNSLKRSENLLEAASTSHQPQPNIENLKSYMRRKLCYPSQEQVKHDDETASPLPEMPDLSQATSSHLSSISSAPGRWPSAASWLVMSSSQESCSHTVISSPSQTPATTIRVPLVCVEKLSQNLTKEGKNSISFYSEDSDKPVFTSKSPSVQQESLSSLLLTQSDFSRTTTFLKTEESHTRVEDDKDDKNSEIPDDVNSMTQISQEGLSPRSSGTDECISPSMKTQLSRAKSFENKAGMEENKTSFLTQVENHPLQEKCEGLSTETHSQTQSWSDFTSHMVLHLDDNDDDDSEGVVSPTLPSPQVPVSKSDQIKLPPTESCIYSISSPFKTPPEGRHLSQSDLTEISKAESKPTASEPSPKVTESGESTVSYYWGVPFCPAGQNPDDYTRVILCQMEVYEKSLKKAQRELLCKAEWGEPICPSSSPKRLCPRRWKPHRTHCFSDDKEENKEEKESKGIVVDESQNEAVQGSVADSQDEPYIILSSPDTKDELLDERPICSQQEHVRKSPDKCFGETERGTQDASDDVTTPCPPEHEAEYEKAYEEEETVCPETQMTDSSTPELMMTSPAQSHADSERMDIEENAVAPAVEEEVMEQECGEAATTPSDESMECPICSKVFPLCQIEMHAADCNGESENHDIEELSPVLTRRTRIRRDVRDQAKHRSEVPAEMEKCYLCHRFFPPQDYPGHVNRCLKTIDSSPDQGNRLLSALDQTETRDSGRDIPGPSDLHTNSGLPDPAVTATRERNVHTSATASSPTVAFSPLSENTHCLIDSEQQDAYKTSQRLSRKRKFKR